MQHEFLLEEIGNEYKHILNENLVGIYVHGSIAFGCYHPKISDIDFIVVVKEKPALEDKVKLIEVLLERSEKAPKKGFEMSVVLEDVCQNFIYPTPFELHYSNAHKQNCIDNIQGYCEYMNGTDVDLAAHFTVINKVGYPVVGKPVQDVFNEVPKKDYLNSIKSDIANAMDDVEKDPTYIILNLCRVLAYIAEEKVFSKKQGGLWGILHVPKEYIAVVEYALARYVTPDEVDNIEINQTLVHEFCNYMIRCIFETEY